MQMNELNPINNFNSANMGAAQARVSANNLSQARSKGADSFQILSTGTFSTQEIEPLVKLLASKLQISELMAYKMVRKFMGTGQAGTLNEMKDFLTDFTKAPSDYVTANKQPVVKQLQELNKKTDTDEINLGFQKITKNLKDIFIQDKLLKDRISGSKLMDTNQIARFEKTLTELVRSPKEFASWLVNNKAAFIALRSSPQVVNILAAMNNPQIQQSPTLMAQLVALLVQILKLKAGKSTTEDIDEKDKTDRDQAFALESSDHDANIVNTIKQTIETIPITPIREFLIEAERFAEEEVANLWSLTLKKERDLEKKLKSSLLDYRAKRDNRSTPNSNKS
jgi:hypothetical protein